jgi:HSP20 family protein
MDIFDDNKKKNRKPFDLFGFDNDFEQMFNQMERIFETTFKNFKLNQLQPGKPFIPGFQVRFGQDDKPQIDEFGNRIENMTEQNQYKTEEIELLTDIIEGDEEIAITIEIPFVDKEDINLKINEKTLEIKVDSIERKYYKIINLPCEVHPEKSNATYKNGVLDIVIVRKEKKDKNGHNVNITS